MNSEVLFRSIGLTQVRKTNLLVTLAPQASRDLLEALLIHPGIGLNGLAAQIQSRLKGEDRGSGETGISFHGQNINVREFAERFAPVFADARVPPRRAQTRA